MADTVTDRVGDAMSTSMEFVQDVAHNVAERAPDVTSAVGRGARSSMDTVADVVSEFPGQVTKMATKLAALTPFVDAPPPPRHRSRWLVGVAIVAIVGVGWWFANRRKHNIDTLDHVNGAPSTAPEASVTERRLASAGR